MLSTHFLKLGKLDFTKVKNNSKKMSRQVTKVSKLFQVHLSDKALTFKIHQKFLYVHNQTPSKNGHKS